MESYCLFFKQSKPQTPQTLSAHYCFTLCSSVLHTCKGKVAPVHDMKAYKWSRCGVAHIFTSAVKELSS